MYSVAYYLTSRSVINLGIIIFLQLARCWVDYVGLHRLSKTYSRWISLRLIDTSAFSLDWDLLVAVILGICKQPSGIELDAIL